MCFSVKMELNLSNWFNLGRLNGQGGCLPLSPPLKKHLPERIHILMLHRIEINIAGVKSKTNK